VTILTPRPEYFCLAIVRLIVCIYILDSTNEVGSAVDLALTSSIYYENATQILWTLLPGKVAISEIPYDVLIPLHISIQHLFNQFSDIASRPNGRQGDFLWPSCHDLWPIVTWPLSSKWYCWQIDWLLWRDVTMTWHFVTWPKAWAIPVWDGYVLTAYACSRIPILPNL